MKHALLRTITTVVLVILSLPIFSLCQNPTSTVAVGKKPWSIAVNTATNKIYVTNVDSNSVTVINGVTNTVAATVNVGIQPTAIAVNSMTNRIYVANMSGRSVTVIDGSADTVISTLGVGIYPQNIAVNRNTNKIYVTNGNSNSVTVINGATNGTSTVNVGRDPVDVAVNTVTNKVYVTNASDNTVMVIDGTSDTVIDTVGVGRAPWALAVNEATNKIYVANNYDSSVTVIDGVTGAASAVNAGNAPEDIAVNSATNNIYVANKGSNTVTVINGLNNQTATVNVGTSPYSVVVNPTTNSIYVTNSRGANVTVINGMTNATTTTGVGDTPLGIAANITTNNVYVANAGSNSVTVIEPAINNIYVGNGGVILACNPTAAAAETVAILPNGDAGNVLCVAKGGRTLFVGSGGGAVYKLAIGSKPVVVAGSAQLLQSSAYGTNITGLVCDTGGTILYACGQNKVFRIDVSKTPWKITRLADFKGPAQIITSCLALGDSGLYVGYTTVAEQFGARVVRISKTTRGKVLSKFDLGSPMEIIGAQNGNVLVAARNHLYLLSKTLRNLASVQIPGGTPNGLALSDDGAMACVGTFDQLNNSRLIRVSVTANTLTIKDTLSLGSKFPVGVGLLSKQDKALVGMAPSTTYGSQDNSVKIINMSGSQLVISHSISVPAGPTFYQAVAVEGQ